MTRIHSTMPHLNGHVLVSLDFETTGARAGYHEIIQIGAVPLNSDLKPLAGIRPFYTNIAPKFIERAETAATRAHGLDLHDLALNALPSDRVADLFVEWQEGLELPCSKVIVPLAHNWAFESSFLRCWLGNELTDRMFHAHARDSMTYAIGINDQAFFAGESAPFNKVSLTELCKHFGVVNTRPHDALCDALAGAEVYRHLVMMDVL